MVGFDFQIHQLVRSSYNEVLESVGEEHETFEWHLIYIIEYRLNTLLQERKIRDFKVNVEKDKTIEVIIQRRQTGVLETFIVKDYARNDKIDKLLND